MKSIKFIFLLFIGLVLIFATSTNSYAQRKKTTTVKKTKSVKETSVQSENVVGTIWEDKKTGWEIEFHPNGKVIFNEYGIDSELEDIRHTGTYRQNGNLIEMLFPDFESKVEAVLKGKEMIVKMFVSNDSFEMLFTKVKK